MKKVYFILAAIAMVSMFSCKKDDGKKDNKKGSDEEATSIIVIDGKFDDWKDVKTVASVADESAYPNLLTMKAVGDEDNLYLFFEYELVEDQNASAIDILINADGKGTTGFSSWIWGDGGCGWEYMLESENGFLADAETYKVMDDLKFYVCEVWQNPTTGEQLDAWGDGAKFKEVENSSSFTENKGVVSNGVAKFELSIPRNTINASKKGNISVGVTATNVVNGDWVTAGILPLEEGVGAGSMLEVALP